MQRLLKRIAKLEAMARRGGTFAADCICFPKNESPLFRIAEDQQTAADLQCPVHEDRGISRFHIFVAAWQWDTEIKYRWPCAGSQYKKAFVASSPVGVPHLNSL
jgi:hypothetical protein